MLTERLGQTQNAAASYQQFAANFPNHEDAPYALFYAGWLYSTLQAHEQAIAAWTDLVARYPQTEWGAAAMIWLLRVLPEEEQGPVLDAAANASVLTYYGLRARDLANGIEPFSHTGPITWAVASQSEAEDWLRQQRLSQLSVSPLVS